jgi:hypothetical protein
MAKPRMTIRMGEGTVNKLRNTGSSYCEDLLMLIVKQNMVYLWLEDASVTGNVVGRIGRKLSFDMGRNMFPLFVRAKYNDVLIAMTPDYCSGIMLEGVGRERRYESYDDV